MDFGRSGATLRRFVLAGVLLFAAVQLLSIVRRPTLHQWDFQTYYFAARAHVVGLDPYDAASRSRVAGHPVPLPYVYPPYTLALFRPLAAMPLAWALRVFVLLKLVALAGLFWLWRKTLGCSLRDPWFAAFSLLALGSTIYCDLVSGNVSIFEQLILWAAFYAYTQRRVGAFCTLVVVASAFKLTPLAFLALAPLARAPRRIEWLAGSVSAVTAAICGTYVMDPRRFGEWVGVFAFAAGRHATPDINPSLLALLSRLFDRAGAFAHVSVPSIAALGVFGLLALAVLAFTGRVIANAPWMQGPHRERELVVIACLVDALVSPRLVLYSFILVLAPLYVLARRASRTHAKPLLLAATVLAFAPNPSTTPLGIPAVMNLVTGYYPLVIVAAAWATYVLSLRANEAMALRMRTDASSESVPPVLALACEARDSGERAGSEPRNGSRSSPVAAEP